MNDIPTQPMATPPQQAIPEAQLHQDPLLDCLIAVARLHGRPTTRAALSAGLPLGTHTLSPALFTRAAARAGLAGKIIRRPLDKLSPPMFPAILLLNGNEACVILSWDESTARYSTLFPETGQGLVLLPAATLLERYTGIALLAKPRFRFDARTPEIAGIKQRHWFWGTLAEQWPIYRDVLTAALLINLFALALPLFTMNVYDRVVPNNATETLWALAIGVSIVMTADFALRMLRSHFVDLASKRVDVKLSAMIMERVLGMRLEGRPASVGSFAANMRAFESVRDLIASATITALIDLPFGLIFLGVMLWISWPLVLPLLIGMFTIGIYAFAVQNKMHALSETTYRAGALRNATLIESLNGLETIKALGAERIMQARWESTAQFLATTSTEMRLMSTAVTTGTMWMQQMISVTVVVLGVYLIAAGELTMGALIASSQLSSRAIAPLSQLIGLMMQYHTAKTSLSSLDKLMSTPIERPPESNFVHRPDLQGDIQFKNVSFAYPGSEANSLNNISLHARPGDRIGILGRIGSGKTTLEKLMLGLYLPTEGAISIDGVDLRQLDPADFRHKIGYVSQDIMLFYGTLRENITFGAPYADDAALIAAVEMAGLTDFVNRHPKGFDMLIGERGDTLSGGQKQAVGLARAILMDPPILLLDEPTSGMDFTTEAQIKTNLQRFMAHKTVILVTHRSSLLDLVNRMIVMDQGQILADGPSDQIMLALKEGRIGKAS